GDVAQAGSCRVDGAAGAVFIGGDILGGEGGSDAGSLRFGATMSALTIGGSIRGGGGGGEILIIGNTKFVLIRGSILGGPGFLTGSFSNFGDLANFKLLGDFVSSATSRSE